MASHQIPCCVACSIAYIPGVVNGGIIVCKDNANPVLTVLKNLWRGWTRIVRRIARWQTIILVTIFYFLALAPLGAVMRLFGWDPLRTSLFSSRQSTNWGAVPDGKPGLESLRRQS